MSRSASRSGSSSAYSTRMLVARTCSAVERAMSRKIAASGRLSRSAHGAECIEPGAEEGRVDRRQALRDFGAGSIQRGFPDRIMPGHQTTVSTWASPGLGLCRARVHNARGHPSMMWQQCSAARRGTRPARHRGGAVSRYST